MGYREIDNNIWLSPYNFEDEIQSIINNMDIRYLFNRGIIETNFDWNIFLNKTFQINKLRKAYKQFIENIENMNKSIDEENMRNGDLLPVLFELGWNFYDIVTDDPALPLHFLEKWVGDKAVNEMREFREYLVNKVSYYFKQKVNIK